jgi:FMN reductase [NAD(P)H]
MDFRDVVRKRRMVRNYRSDPVDPAAVARIIAAGRRAPSAGFSQGHYFIVMTEEKTRRALADLAHEEEYVAQGMHPWISSAPVHIAVCIREADYHERYREFDKLTGAGEEIQWPVPYWWVDAGGALILVLLAAVNEGLAAGFFGTHRLEGFAELLGLPPDVTPIGVVTVGHPAADKRSSSLERGWKPASSVVHHEKWGTPYEMS